MKDDVKKKAKAKTKAVPDATPEPEAERDGLPTAKFGPLSKMADRAAEILIEAKVPFYQRGDELVRPVILPVDTFHGKDHHLGPARRGRPPLHARHDVQEVAVGEVGQAQGGSGWTSTRQQDAALVLLKRYGDWNFPAIAGIISTPTLRPDGTILSTAGFDKDTRLLLVDPPKMPPIPEKPTKDDAVARAGTAQGSAREFPFRTCNADDNKSVSRSVALSAYLTTVCRAAFPVAPMHVGDAPVGCLRQELPALHRQRHRHRSGHAGDRRRQERGGDGEAARRCRDQGPASDLPRQRGRRARRRGPLPADRAAATERPRPRAIPAGRGRGRGASRSSPTATTSSSSATSDDGSFAIASTRRWRSPS